MKIQTLKDLKLALKDVPDEVLESFGAGQLEETYVQLMAWAGDEEPEEIWEKNKKYSTLNDIDKWIQNISRVSQQMEKEEDYGDIGFEEAISSEDKI